MEANVENTEKKQNKNKPQSDLVRIDECDSKFLVGTIFAVTILTFNGGQVFTKCVEILSYGDWTFLNPEFGPDLNRLPDLETFTGDEANITGLKTSIWMYLRWARFLRTVSAVLTAELWANHVS